MASIARTLAELIEQIRPAAIFTHAYEGGHPDHDAAAFAVHCAVGLVSRRGTPAPVVNEFTSYHNGSPFALRSWMRVGEFLQHWSQFQVGQTAGLRQAASPPSLAATLLCGAGPWPAAGSQPALGQGTVVLSADARYRKRRMFECFASQKHMLESFPIALERVRPAPEYDFTRPPHDGRLFYEDQDWGWDGPSWRRAAGRALAELG
jgi:LmbE family N-acetylglucosaminyl deacetylase